MKFSTLKSLWFWSRTAWSRWLSSVRRASNVATNNNLSRRPHGSFVITQDSHPRKVQRWMNRGGSTTLSTSDLARAAQRHLHPNSKYAPY